MDGLGGFVKAHLQRHAQSVECQRVDEDDVFLLCSGGKNTGMNCCIRVRERTRNICITASNGIKAPARRMPQAYELVCRLNVRMVVGQFWIASDDGEISFTVTANLLELQPTEAWFGSLVHTAFATFDRYFPIISTVLYGRKAPSAAVSAVEGPSNIEITQSLERLFSTPQEKQPEQPAPEESGCVDAPPVDGAARRRAIRKITAQITPQEIEEVLKEHRRRTRRGKADDSK